jgi:hypothetical protein
MTRSPAGQEPPVEGGGAAERLRQFLRARFGNTGPDAVLDDEEEADDTPESEAPAEADG